MEHHPYIPNASEAAIKRLLQEIGVASVDDLFSDIPRHLWIDDLPELPPPHTEYEAKKIVQELLSQNSFHPNLKLFLGGGVWLHYIPSVIWHLISRGEFLTSYTPYQAEISQGVLQAVFEYQSMICELTGMDVANASMYDWASALGEAALFATRVTKRKTFIIPKNIAPQRKRVLLTYTQPVGIAVKEVSYSRETGLMDLDDLTSKLDDETSAVYLENPSYLGPIEDRCEEIGEIAHSKGALFIVGVDPLSLALLKAPGDYGADVVIGEGQPLGLPPSFGGPLLGIFACRDDMKLIRQMPGRIVGLTTTKDGQRRAFTLALTTREQHIRRERATSNICTNETLCAIASAIYMALLGGEGLRELSKIILCHSHYAMKKLNSIPGVKAPLFDAPHFKDFTVKLEGAPTKEVYQLLLKKGIQPGNPLTDSFPELGESLLLSVTELHTKDDIDLLAALMEEVLSKCTQ